MLVKKTLPPLQIFKAKKPNRKENADLNCIHKKCKIRKLRTKINNRNGKGMAIKHQNNMSYKYCKRGKATTLINDSIIIAPRKPRQRIKRNITSPQWAGRHSWR